MEVVQCADLAGAEGDHSSVRAHAIPPVGLACGCQAQQAAQPEGPLAKSAREIMEILEAFDLTRCVWSAAELVGCNHKTVPATWRCAMPVPTRPPRRGAHGKSTRSFTAKVEELVERSARPPGQARPRRSGG